MKRNGLMLLCAAVLAFSSCEKDDVSEEPKIVDVCFDVQFPQSGSMTRGANEDYLNFYNNHIKNKELVPQNYNLTITNDKNERIATMKGKWDITSLQLPVGTYRITGRSDGDFSIASLIFDEEINITSSGTITLTAQYNCFLLMFPTNEGASNYEYIRGTSLSNKGYEMPTIDNLSYMFMSDLTTILYIAYTTNEGHNSLNLDNESFNFKPGFYYYFDTISGSFNVPPMQNGR